MNTLVAVGIFQLHQLILQLIQFTRLLLIEIKKIPHLSILPFQCFYLNFNRMIFQKFIKMTGRGDTVVLPTQCMVYINKSNNVQKSYKSRLSKSLRNFSIFWFRYKRGIITNIVNYRIVYKWCKIFVTIQCHCKFMRFPLYKIYIRNWLAI